MSNTILVDIDHTLRASWPRDFMLGSDWDAYHIAAENDAPVEDMKKVINALHYCGYTIVAVTSIPEKWRGSTMKWMTRCEINVHEMLMRPPNNFMDAPTLKMLLALEHFGGSLESMRDEVIMVFDDREDVVTAFRGLGISACQFFARQR